MKLDIGFKRLPSIAWSAEDVGRLERLFTGLASDWNKKSLQKLRTSLRTFLFEHQKRRCAYCRLPITENLGNAELDHIIPKELAPQFTYCRLNLVLACKRCNHRKHNHNPTLQSDWNLLFLATCPLASGAYKWVHPFIHDYSEHIEVSEAWVYRPIKGSRKAKAVIQVCKLAETREVVARTRFSEALASADDWRAVLYLMSRQAPGVPDDHIADEFFRYRPSTTQTRVWVLREIRRVREGKLDI